MVKRGPKLTQEYDGKGDPSGIPTCSAGGVTRSARNGNQSRGEVMRFASCVFGKLFAARLLHYQGAVRNANQSLLILNPSSREGRL
jgi:hypothetical protein